MRLLDWKQRSWFRGWQDGYAGQDYDPDTAEGEALRQYREGYKMGKEERAQDKEVW